MNKDWMDAVRERCLPDGALPSSDGWGQVGRKMRRAAARRRSVLAAAVMLPVAALLLWSPWRQTAVPALPTQGPAVAIQDPVTPSIPDPVLPIQDPVNLIQAPVVPIQKPVMLSEANEPVAPSAQQPAPPANPIAPDSTDPRAPVSAQPESRQAQTDASNPPVLLAWDDPTPRQRTRISLGVHAGTNSVRRDATVSLHAVPYVAALTYLNSHLYSDNSVNGPAVKSNVSNTIAIANAANEYYPEYASGRYTHDLPLSLGLTLRVDLTPRTGLESGLEYTYLHSVEEYAGDRLDQQLHFIGIPVRLETALWTRGGWDLYAGMGGKVEKCVSAKLGMVACEEPRLQWSAEAFGGIQYKLSPRTFLYFQPALSYYFTKTDLPTCRTEHPLGFSLHAGLRFDL